MRPPFDSERERERRLDRGPSRVLTQQIKTDDLLNFSLAAGLFRGWEKEEVESGEVDSCPFLDFFPSFPPLLSSSFPPLLSSACPRIFASNYLALRSVKVKHFSRYFCYNMEGEGGGKEESRASEVERALTPHSLSFSLSLPFAPSILTVQYFYSLPLLFRRIGRRRTENSPISKANPPLPHKSVDAYRVLSACARPTCKAP